MNALARSSTLWVLTAALLAGVALLSGCGVVQNTVTGTPAAAGSSVDPARSPPAENVHTEEPDGSAVYDVEEGLHVDSWGFRSYKFTDASTYEASWGVVVSNSRGGNWIPVTVSFEITFLDAAGVEVGKDDYPGLTLMAPGGAAAASGQADGLTGPPAKVHVRVFDVEWSEEPDAGTLKDAVTIDVERDERFIITDAVVTTKAKVTNVTTNPIRVNLQVLYLDSDDGILAGAPGSIREIPPGETAEVDLLGSGTKDTLAQFNHILIFAQTWPERIAEG